MRQYALKKDCKLFDGSVESYEGNCWLIARQKEFFNTQTICDDDELIRRGYSVVPVEVREISE
jgi:hypothetical protein